ncbi:cyclin-domain-containing protein [Amylocarpus encephaloides]|uniref:Cyclin-domain-containing protein n=1 Tax=Amylocarpus encephaloides TaxID=45428 RepID=A0A9P7YRV1_9HELO|nr:cyclin-domain-containing protein [Amylocarpus encephaloides]
MAAVISDFGNDLGSDTTRSHYHHSLDMRNGSGQQRSSAESPYRQPSRAEVPPSPRFQPCATPSAAAAHTSDTHGQTNHPESGVEIIEGDKRVKTEQQPSPPSSSSPSRGSYSKTRFSSQENMPNAYSNHETSLYADNPASKYESPHGSAEDAARILARSTKSLDDVKGYSGNTINVRDLSHIQSFANEEFLARGRPGRRRGAEESTVKYEISGMPIADIIEMVAGLLTKITTTNDQQHESLHRPLSSGEPASNLSGYSTSVLAFHGKNVPSITILSYLSRIHKYCPTTYEVFLSLLVYFDRMTHHVNEAPMQALRRDSAVDQENSRPSTSYSAQGSDLADSPPVTSRSVPEMDADFQKAQYATTAAPEPNSTAMPLSHFFVVDSFNIHRLVIAGVTCASKFFSDVFYTNSRYAKVGGLPLIELNHLELQFLLLNDFRLSVPVEELEAYGTMLVEFYAREVIAQRKGSVSASP